MFNKGTQSQGQSTNPLLVFAPLSKDYMAEATMQ